MTSHTALNESEEVLRAREDMKRMRLRHQILELELQGACADLFRVAFVQIRDDIKDYCQRHNVEIDIEEFITLSPEFLQEKN